MQDLKDRTIRAGIINVAARGIGFGIRIVPLWLNVAFGGLLALTAIAVAPVVSRFYHEPRTEDRPLLSVRSVT